MLLLLLASLSASIVSGTAGSEDRIGGVSSESKICSEIGIGLLERGGVSLESPGKIYGRLITIECSRRDGRNNSLRRSDRDAA
jgi:hypothetical protein